MDVGAIVLIEAQRGNDESRSPSGVADSTAAARFAGGAPAFVDVLGRSVLEHTVDRLRSANLKCTSLIVHSDLATSLPVFRQACGDLSIRVADDPWSAVASVLETYSKNGCECALITRPTAYVEGDLMDLLDFHREGQRVVTRISDRVGPLDLWVMNCNPTAEIDRNSLMTNLLRLDSFPASYLVKQYTRRISHPRDLRHFVTDAFLNRCHLHPLGEQIRPGVWVDQGVEIHRRACIVAPAYLGARCTIGERAVINRFSNIEHDSYIDYGTVIENSSILSNTHVGIWLDVRHSIVCGNQLLNLERDVMVEICDPRLLRSTLAAPHAKRTPAPEPQRAYASPRPQERLVNRISSINTTTEFES